MDELGLTHANIWLDWVAVFSYIGFAAFIAWCVMVKQ